MSDGTSSARTIVASMITARAVPSPSSFVPATHDVIVVAGLPELSLIVQPPALPGGEVLECPHQGTQGPLPISRPKEEMEVIGHQAPGIEEQTSVGAEPVQ